LSGKQDESIKKSKESSVESDNADNKADIVVSSNSKGHGSEDPRSSVQSIVSGSSVKLSRDFYTRHSCEGLAKALLGKRLVRLMEGTRLSARIVETEAYLGFEDKASHSYKGRRTPRNEAMFMEPGTAYVYSIYGCYVCFNISSQGSGAAVLLRALEVLEGVEQVKAARPASTKANDKHLANGPSKLCQALSLTKDGHNQRDTVTCPDLWLEDDLDIDPDMIVAAPRIGLGPSAEEWGDKPLRFYVLGHPCVSKRNRQCEDVCRAARTSNIT